MQLEWNLRTINKKKIYSIIFGFFGAVGGGDIYSCQSRTTE